MKPRAMEAHDFAPSAGNAQACWAAVSFVFQDAPWCDWIYREFDGSRVPRPLAGRPSRHGVPYPDRISVSPDPSDPQQLETYADTLRTAQHLIIVVSPNSFHEEVTQEHIRIFRAAGGEERIVAVVVKGDPASPSAAAGTTDDAAWLPQWLAYRFKDNAFEPGPPCEPLVIDARLGVSSLAEVRAKLCAALLEVTVPQLGELGVGVRYTAADLAPHASPVIVPMPEPTPLPTLASLAKVEDAPSRKHSRWPVVLCSVAAVAALGFLAFWPAHNAAVAANNPGDNQPNFTPAPAKPEKKPATQIRDAEPLVAIVTLTNQAPPLPGAGTPATDTPKTAETARNAAPPADTVTRIAAVPPASTTDNTTANPAPAAIDGLSQSTSADAPPLNEALERKRFELASRRDRLVRMGESKINSGDLEEGIASFEQALETANELVQRTNGGHDEVMELALLYRRCGNVVTSVNSTAEGRTYFERGRRALQSLRGEGKLPREAGKILTDLEKLAHPSRD